MPNRQSPPSRAAGIRNKVEAPEKHEGRANIARPSCFLYLLPNDLVTQTIDDKMVQGII